VADSLFLSLWFSSFELDEMLPRALAVMRQFPFSAQQPGISYVALHPVSWNEPTIFEQRCRHGITPEEAVLLASDLLHEDYAYLFEAFWDLWILAEDRQWSLHPSQVKFLVHGVEFETELTGKTGMSRWILASTRLSFRMKCDSRAKLKHEFVPTCKSSWSSRIRRRKVPALVDVYCGRNQRKTSHRN
jgi:hypothetical protein